MEERESGSRFVLSRDTYLEPDKPYDVFRSRELVEQKNNKTFGEVDVCIPYNKLFSQDAKFNLLPS